MATPGPYLSVIIPAYNEETRLPASLAQLKEFLSHEPWPSEVVVVDDGSADRTAKIVREWMRDWPDLHLVEGPHRGKGGAVQAGILAATGQYVALADADFAMPVAEFRRFFPALDEGCAIVIGSREAAGAKRFYEPKYRHIMGRVFNGLVRVLLLQGIKDTQCGFKVLRRDAATLLCQQQTLNGWGFDVELLVIARLCGYRVAEVGIPWYYMPGSRVNPVRDTVTMFTDILHIRRNLRKHVYRAPSLVVRDEELLVPSSPWDEPRHQPEARH
jgi:dolichyl-phosphate beta-glucosyltransferase